jgi:hypothetical protein
LLNSGLTSLSEREQRVILHIAKRLHVARNVNSVLEQQQTFGEPEYVHGKAQQGE